METVKTRRPLWSLRLALPIVLALVVAAVIWHQNSKPTAATSPPGPPDARDLVSQWHIDFKNARIVIRQGALDRTSGENLEPDDRTTHDAPIEEDTVRFGYVFEPEHLALTADDENKLVAALLKPASLSPWIGPKMCGGFYPDYSIQVWQDKYPALEIHLCFGCSEAKVHAQEYFMIAELSSDTFSALKEILPRARLASSAPPGQNPATPTASPPPSY